MANSLAACLHSVGFEMPRAHDVVPLLGVDGVMEALTARLQSIVLVQPLFRVLCHAQTSSGLSLIGGIVSFLFLGGACSDFCSVKLLAACLHSAGFEIPRVHNVVPLFRCRWCCGAQQIHVGVLNYIIDCLNFMNI